MLRSFNSFVHAVSARYLLLAMIDGCLRLEWVSGAVGRTGSAPKRHKIATYAISPVNPVRNFLPALRCIRVCRPQPSRAATPRHADALRPSLSEDRRQPLRRRRRRRRRRAGPPPQARPTPPPSPHRCPAHYPPSAEDRRRRERRRVRGAGVAGPPGLGVGAGMGPRRGGVAGGEGAAAGVAGPEAGWRAAFLAAP
jgi:hypothetical protein